MAHLRSSSSAPTHPEMQHRNTPARLSLAVASQRAVQQPRPYNNDTIGHPSQMITGTMRIGQHFYPQQQQQQQRHHHPRPQLPARSPFHMSSKAAPAEFSTQHKAGANSAVTTLLPYCTADIPLNGSQVIAITDIVGSLKELVILALAAKDGDQESLGRLRSALGSEQAVAGFIDFFSDEYETG